MKLQVGEVFGSHMVLQRDKEVAVWGRTEPGTTVTVSIQGQQVTTTSEEDGRWRLTLQPLRTSIKEEMLISDGGDRLVFEDVQVGEVWLAGGQSNMEFFMRYDKDYPEEAEHCENPDLRFYDYPELANDKARQLHDYSLFGYWRRCTKDDLQYYSAVAYYFARDLQKALQVPVGIVACNCGGTRSQCWMDEETLKTCGPEWLEDYEKGLHAIPDLAIAEQQYLSGAISDHSHPFDNPLSDRLMYGTTLEELQKALKQMQESGAPVIGPWSEWRPSGLYHTMLEHVMPYTIRGVIWYQGESDEDHPEIYNKMMTGLIQLWRRKWKDALPFLTVQLAPFGLEPAPGGAKYPLLRRQQEETSKEVPNVWMTTTGDVGNLYDIHPKEKQPVGRRLALLARGHVYGENILCDPPEADITNIQRKGRHVTIPFLHAEGGLMRKGDHVNSLRVLYGDQMLAFTENIQGETLQLMLEEMPCAADSSFLILFEEEPYYEANLYNQAGIPAKPFTAEI